MRRLPNNKKWAYLSFPISGQDIPTLREKISLCQDKILLEHPEWHIINPLELCSDIESNPSLTARQKYAREMGRDIEIILQSEAFIYIADITDTPSVGCNIEIGTVTQWNQIHADEPITEYIFLNGELFRKWW